ncbi:MAG: cobalamin biosynthesis protein CbiX [Paracoccaceae bacterium]|nr:MAG: cobalamin biosynthesis protein CbiX [Paracoccaceae bacterium]
MPAALIVAHGSPADPGPQEDALIDLAARVSARLPGWGVRGATLAAEGALERALADLDRPLIYPFFMAEGWFTRTALPRRLREAGHGTLARLPAFGVAPELPAIAARAAIDGAQMHGLVPQETTLLIAAHGSQVSRASAEGARAIAALLGHMAPFRRVLTGFIEEPPHLFDVARGLGTAICLPFFALRAGHVAEDVPDALEQAGFRGPLLPAVGEHPEVPRIIAAGLARGPA